MFAICHSTVTMSFPIPLSQQWLAFMEKLYLLHPSLVNRQGDLKYWTTQTTRYSNPKVWSTFSKINFTLSICNVLCLWIVYICNSCGWQFANEDWNSLVVYHPSHPQEEEKVGVWKCYLTLQSFFSYTCSFPLSRKRSHVTFSLSIRGKRRKKMMERKKTSKGMLHLLLSILSV
jgi:hypothetical protein